MGKKVIKLSESEITNIVKKIINENDRTYGSENIKSLYSDMADDEYVDLDDSSGALSGQIVKKKEYIRRQLKDAIRTNNWEKVHNVVLFIDSMM